MVERQRQRHVAHPVGIKRLLGQSPTAVLGSVGQEKAGIVVAKPALSEETPADI